MQPSNTQETINPPAIMDSKKKTKHIIAFIIAILIILSGLGIACYYNFGNKIEVNAATIQTELGDPVSFDASHYLKAETPDDILKETVISSDIVGKGYHVNQDTKTIVPDDGEFLPVGDYTFKITYKNRETETVNLTVADTTAPVFTEDTPNELRIEKDATDVDFKEFFACTDLSESFITVKDDNVDLGIEGNYELIVYAKDAFDNRTEKVVRVIVVSMDEARKENGVSATLNGKIHQSDALRKKIEEEKKAAEEARYPKSYSDDTCSIHITKEWYKNAWCYIAHVKISDYSRFGTSNGKDVYGGTETTSSAAKRLGSILTINGSYEAPHLNYGVVRSGKVVNDKQATSMPGIYGRSHGILSSSSRMGYDGQSLSSLANAGKVSDTFCFGPEFNTGIGIQNTSRAQRTFIGSNEQPGDFWLIVSDGRYNDGESAGLTYKECWDLLKSKGCSYGAPLDGGGSSTMVFQGLTLNATKGNERAIVDFVYVK